MICSPESSANQDAKNEISRPTENFVKSENNTEFVSQQVLQENDSTKDESTHSKVFNGVTVQTEARQRSNSNSRHQGLFKENVLVHSDALSSFSPAINC